MQTGPVAIRSTKFDVRRDDETYVFFGTGYGHGVGLCQDGAEGMARDGWDFERILNWYYTSVRIEKYRAGVAWE